MILRPLFFLFCSLLFVNSWAQETQRIRGVILDQDSKFPLIGATIRVLNYEPLTGTVTDSNGQFRLPPLPLGRVSLQVNYVGYEAHVLPNILLTAAKEVVLTIELSESIEKLDEVVVTATASKAEVLNEMAVVSARTFSVEETQRYAGAFSDPARMVSAFAGVTGTAEGNNDIVVRGNNSKGILWRLEGIEIPNPNHFANEGATGGPINALNSNMLDNSDFYSGAFAPEFGNALSGVFDMRFKKGNNERHEFTFGASVFGIDFAAEGPLSSQKKGSYIANYRYSSLQLISQLGFLDFGGIPKYQDLSFHVVMPLSGSSQLSLFGLGGLSNIQVVEEEKDGTKLYRGNFGADLGILGLSHLHFFTDRFFIKNTISLGSAATTSQDEFPNDLNEYYLVHKGTINKTTARVNTLANVKINAQHKVETGIIYSLLGFDSHIDLYNFDRDVLENILQNDGHSYSLQAYASWKYRMSDALTMTGGLHTLYFGLNGAKTVEPRLAFKFQPMPRHQFTFGAGLHSRLETITTYLTQVPDDQGVYAQINRSLRPSKAAHIILGYDLQISPLTHFKMETYYQHLYQVPIDSSKTEPFSLLNFQGSYSTLPLTNAGTGRNYGAEFTLERFFDKGVYYLATLSVYESFYTAADKRERRSAFNGNYAANLLGGKEFALGPPAKKRTAFMNTKVSLIGGARYTPIDLAASREQGIEVRHDDRPFSSKGDDIFFINLSAGLRRNKKNTTREFKIDITNLTNHQAIVNEYFIDGTDEIEQSPQLPFLPNIVYSLKF